MNLVPVDDDPFAAPAPALVPVDHDPFAMPSAKSPGMMAGVSRALEANLPFVDRAVAAAKSALPQGYGGTGQDYAANLAAEKAKNAQFAEQNPWTNAVGGITAYAPAALIPGGGTSLFSRVGAGAATGFGLGGVQGLSNSPDLTNSQQTGRSIAEGELTGSALGASLPVLGEGIGKGVSALAGALHGGPGAADLAALQTAKNTAYQNVKDLGAAYSPQSFSSLVNDIAANADEQGINSSLHPGATSVISKMQARADQGTPVSLPELDQLRQIAWRDSAGKQGPDNGGERFFGNQIRNKIDEFTNAGFPGDMVPMPAKAPAPTPSGQGSLPLAEEATGLSQVPLGPAPTPMLDFLRRSGGVKDEGGDLASMGFSNLKGVAAKGSSKIIDKENGLPMDEARRMAVESGYMEPHETVSDFISKLGEHPTYSVHDEEAVAAQAARDEYDQGPQEEEIAPPMPPVAPAGPPVASAQEAAAAIQNARDLAQRQFKANALLDALNKAEIRTQVSGTGGNIENATRQRLAAILAKEPWSAAEKAQLNKMVLGTPYTNTLRQVSRLSPIGNALTTLLEGGGALASGPGLPGLAAAAGAGAQGLGALARRNMQNELMRTVLAGGKIPATSSTVAPRLSRAAIAAALGANADLQAQRNQTTPQ
jgi:hypothetical protein